MIRGLLTPTDDKFSVLTMMGAAPPGCWLQTRNSGGGGWAAGRLVTAEDDCGDMFDLDSLGMAIFPLTDDDRLMLVLLMLLMLLNVVNGAVTLLLLMTGW